MLNTQPNLVSCFMVIPIESFYQKPITGEGDCFTYCHIHLYIILYVNIFLTPTSLTSISENCYCCKAWNRASVTTTSQMYLALSHGSPGQKNGRQATYSLDNSALTYSIN